MPDPNTQPQPVTAGQQAPIIPQQAAAQPQPAPPTLSPIPADVASGPAPNVSQPDTTQVAGPTVSPWKRILMGALVGMAGGADGKNFAQGLAGGTQASLNYVQQQHENQVQQQQVEMQKQRLAMEQTQAADSHALSTQQLAVAQAQLAKLHLDYQLAPKSLQDVMDQKDMQAGTQLTAEGVPTVATGLNKADAYSTITAHRNADPNSALQYVMHQTPDGKFTVWQVTDPGKLNGAAVDVTIGYDPKGNPITKTYGPGSITTAQRMNLEANALNNYVNQQNELAKFTQEQKVITSQTGARAYATESARVKADMAALSAPKDANGNWNPSSLPVMLVDGNMDPSQLSKRSKDYDAKLQLANQYSLQRYGKPFNIAQATNDFKYAQNTQTQNTLKMINGMTEPGGSIAIAQKAAQGLPEHWFTPVNKLFNASRTISGNPAETNFHAAMLGLADEYSKIMGGGQPTDTGRQQALDILKSSYSKGQINGGIGILLNDIAARKKAIIGTNSYLMRQYGQTASGPATPTGATMQVPGTDGKMHWSDGKRDLGVVQ